MPVFTGVVDLKSEPNERQNDIRFVLGPSGSGKTFFGVKDAATRELDKKNKYVIVYIKMTEAKFLVPIDTSKIVQLVKDVLLKECKFEGVLDLHLSLVLDEAGATIFKDYFEYVSNVTSILDELKTTLAKSVRIVVCGTGLTAKKYGTDGDAKKYRMKPFSMTDIVKLNEKMFHLDPFIIETMKEHPGLTALMTNGRTARFLLQETQILFQIQSSPFHSDIRRQMINLAPQIIRSVANRYVYSNGIQGLNSLERCRVAAYTFDALEKTRNGIVYIPEFTGLSSDEYDVAKTLVSINVEESSNGTSYIPDYQTRSISLSPALTVLVYLLSGVPIDTLLDWKMQEMNNALYEFRRSCRYYISCYNSGEISMDELNRNLMMSRIIKLGKRVPEPGATIRFAIPLLDKNTIWVNGDNAPFADVVAPFMLYQSKYSQSKSPKYNLFIELEKCGLLKNSQNDRNQIGWIITKSLELMWNLNIERNEKTRSDISNKDVNGASMSQFFYPETQLIGPIRQPVEEYATIYNNSNEWILVEPNGNETKVDIEQDLSKEIVFTIGCNQNEVVLERNGQNNSTTHTMTISCACLDDDGNVQEDRLAYKDRQEWAFYQGLLRTNVTIRFLLS